MERMLLSITVMTIIVQYFGYLLLRIDIRRIEYADSRIRELPTLTARLPLLGVVVPLWYLYHRNRLKRKTDNR